MDKKPAVLFGGEIKANQKAPNRQQTPIHLYMRLELKDGWLFIVTDEYGHEQGPWKCAFWGVMKLGQNNSENPTSATITPTHS